MSPKNLNRWEPTKLQIDKIILPAYTDLSKKCVSYINQLDCPVQNIADIFDILRDISDEIMNSYPVIKNNNNFS